MQLVEVDTDKHTVEYGNGDCDSGISGCYNGDGK